MLFNITVGYSNQDTNWQNSFVIKQYALPQVPRFIFKIWELVGSVDVQAVDKVPKSYLTSSTVVEDWPLLYQLLITVWP